MQLSLKKGGKTRLESENDYYTGEKDKVLFVHVMQGNVEVDKPIKSQIWKQQVEWRGRLYPISHEDFIVDSKGMHHQYVNANNTSCLRFGGAIDNCVKCGGKMTIDARNARELLKRNTIQAIWGIDSTHVILLMILGMGLLAVVGFAVYEYTQGQALQTKIDSALASQSLKPLAPDKPSETNSQTNTVIVH